MLTAYKLYLTYSAAVNPHGQMPHVSVRGGRASAVNAGYGPVFSEALVTATGGSSNLIAVGLSLEPPSQCKLSAAKVEVGTGAWVSLRPPFELDDGWRLSIGELGVAEVEQCDLWLCSSRGPADPDEATRWYQALALHHRFRLQFARRVEVHGGSVRRYTRMKKYLSAFSPANITGPIDDDVLRAAKLTGDQLSDHQRAGRWGGRLGRGTWSLLFGLRQEYGEFRHLDLVRALDALLYAPNAKAFAERGKRLFDCSPMRVPDAQEVLLFVYRLRSCIEHGESITTAMRTLAAEGCRYSEQQLVTAAQELAAACYIAVIAEPAAATMFAQDDLKPTWTRVLAGQPLPVHVQVDLTSALST